MISNSHMLYNQVGTFGEHFQNTCVENLWNCLKGARDIYTERVGKGMSLGGGEWLGLGGGEMMGPVGWKGEE